MTISIFTPDLAEALGWTLLHSLWQGALIFVLLVAALSLLKQQPPQVRYQVLCLGLLVLLGGMSATFYFYLPEAHLAAELTATDPGLTDHPIMADQLSKAITSEILISSGWQESVSSFVRLYAGQLVNIWLLGALFFGLRWLVSYGYTFRLRSQSVQAAPENWQQQLQSWSRQLGIRKKVQLLESIRVEVPMIIGHFKPVILLPMGTLIGLSPEQLGAILLHELAHIRRHDFLVNLLLSALEMLLFYHPVFWWISNKIAQEREQCCDDIAVAACGNPRLYARTLLLMEEKRQQNSLAMAYQGKKNHLLDRIKRICLASPASYRPEFGKAGLSLVLLLLVGAMSWAQMPAEMPLPPEPLEVEPELPAVDLPSAVSMPEMPEMQEPLPLPEVADVPEPTAVEPQGRTYMFNTDPTFDGLDTIPYVPKIPAMRNQPQLPAAPAFPYDREALRAALQKNGSDHQFLRNTVSQYQESINKWQDQIKQSYLKVWSDRQQEIKAAFVSWQQQMKSESRNDELAYAIAVLKGTEYFADAVREHEDAIKKSEEAVKTSIEDYIKTFEDVIRDHEGEKADHDERMRVHDDRMRVHDLRMSVHDGRMSLHDQRMSIHDTRMSFHDERMKAHDVIMAAFEKELFSSLEADGLYRSGSKQLDFRVHEGKVSVNGTELAEQQAQKYIRLLQKYGFSIPEIAGHQFIFNIDGNSKSIGNQISTKE